MLTEEEGLLGGAKPAADKQPAVDPNVNDVSTTPPDGSPPVDAPQRPEWLPENFWDAEKGEPNVQGMAKSYSELRKAFNEKNNDKPGKEVSDYMSEEFYDEEGNFKVEGVELNKEDPVLQKAYEIAKDMGMGVKQANEFISKFAGNMTEFIPEGIDPEAELAKLGENGESIVTGLKTWVDGMKNNGEMDDEVYNAVLELGKTAAGIKALEVLRSKTGELAPPIGESLSGSTHMSLQDWYNATYETHAEAGESKEAFRQRMSDLGRKLIGNGHGTFDGSGFGIKSRR